MKQPDIVPEKLDNPINYVVFGLIIGSVIAFHVFINMIEDEGLSDVIISIVSFINPLASSIAAFVIARRYRGSEVFGKAYFSLALAFLMVFLAEVTYLIYDLVLGIEPYPSIADVFFFMLYPFTLIHLILNIRFFNPHIPKVDKIWMPILVTGILSIYIFTALNDAGEMTFDVAYGIIFTGGSSITLAFAALGAKTFKEGVLGKAWLILLIGILATTIGDVYYYYLEAIGDYSLHHPVNMFWYASYWIIIYALIKHKSII